MDTITKGFAVAGSAHARMEAALNAGTAWQVFRLGQPYVTASSESAARAFCGKLLGKTYTIAPK
jgi:hypothetical protein